MINKKIKFSPKNKKKDKKIKFKSNNSINS